MRKFLGTVFIVLIVLTFGGCFLLMGKMAEELHIEDKRLSKPSILFLKLDGVIIDGKKFLEDLREYAKDKDIKGVLVQINSPGGVVGPSQEIYAELKRVREELKKPVVATCLSVAASGAYYAAAAADQIVTNPGTLVGSIGVIMEFANLEKLYEWAKIKRYTIQTGAYKDAGAEYREMRPDERLLFQSMANEVLLQFKTAISESRKMPLEKVTQYADGRVFTGASAVALGFADKVGTYEDARRIIGQLAGLGTDPEVFEPPPERGKFFEEILSSAQKYVPMNVSGAVERLTHFKLLGQPLFLMPGVHLD